MLDVDLSLRLTAFALMASSLYVARVLSGRRIGNIPLWSGLGMLALYACYCFLGIRFNNGITGVAELIGAALVATSVASFALGERMLAIRSTGTVRGTSGHVSDIAEGNTLLHGQETVAFGDAGYQGIEKRPDAKTGVTWHVAMRPGKRKAHNKEKEADALIDQAEKLKAGVRAKVEHPFRVLKRQFGFVKDRYRGLKKNTAQLFTLFALSNLWMVRSKLLGVGA